MTRVVICRGSIRVDDVLDMRSRPSPPRLFRQGDTSFLRLQSPPLSPFPKELHVNAFPAQPFSRCKCVCKAIVMASSLPLPIPPRTPTPPSDEASDHYAAQMPSRVAIDRDALSPLRDTFPRTMPLDSGNPDRLSPTRSSFTLSSSPTDTAPAVQNGSSDSTAAGPFNFNTTVMAKGPVVKSVCLQWTGDFCQANSNMLNPCARTSDNVVVTNTSTAVSRTRYSSNLPRGHP